MVSGINHLPPHLAWADAFFMVLAAANIFGTMARRDGWRAAAASFLIIALVSGLAETVGVLTGFPFGSYDYTPYFGWKIGGVLPFTIPLAWFVVLGSCHDLATLWLRERPRWKLAFVTAVGATLLDWVMEPFACRIKSYWLWNTPEIPWQNYASWFVLSFILTASCPWGKEPLRRSDPRSAVVLGAMLATFALGRIMHGV